MTGHRACSVLSMRMRPALGRALGACLVALLVAACGSGSADDGATGPDSSSIDTTTGEDPQAEPEVVLERFFSALADQDWAATQTDVAEEQLAVLTAVEGATGPEVASMLRSGVPDSVRRDFWQGFAEGLPALSDLSVGRIRVGSTEALADADTSGDEAAAFASVEIDLAVGGEGGEPAAWILRSTGGGPWRVDLFATFGAVFSPNLAAWYADLEIGDDRDVIARAITAGAPSLRLGVDTEPLGPISGRAVDGVDALLDAVGA